MANRLHRSDTMMGFIHKTLTDKMKHILIWLIFFVIVVVAEYQFLHVRQVSISPAEMKKAAICSHQPLMDFLWVEANRLTQTW